MVNIESFDNHSELDIIALYAITRIPYSCNKISELLSQNVITFNSKTAHYDLTDKQLEQYFETIDAQLRKEDIRIEDKFISEFKDLAKKMIALFPSGIKPNTSKYWRGNIFEVCRKLETLSKITELTEEKVLNATKKYIEFFKDDCTEMRILPYFILKVEEKDGEYEYISDLMTVMEELEDNPNLESFSFDTNWISNLK